MLTGFTLTAQGLRLAGGRQCRRHHQECRWLCSSCGRLVAWECIQAHRRGRRTCGAPDPRTAGPPAVMSQCRWLGLHTAPGQHVTHSAELDAGCPGGAAAASGQSGRQSARLRGARSTGTCTCPGLDPMIGTTQQHIRHRSRGSGAETSRWRCTSGGEVGLEGDVARRHGQPGAHALEGAPPAIVPAAAAAGTALAARSSAEVWCA